MALDFDGTVAQLMRELRDQYNLRDFVETGTFQAATAVWADGIFDQVTTIELSEELHRRAAERHADRSIRFVHGSSRDRLREVVHGLPGPSLFWLDGHWSGGETAGADDECPVLEELAIIDESPHEHFVFIDDARLFLMPPPAPHRASDWPTLDALVPALSSRNDAGIVVLDDIIIRAPAWARADFMKRCHEIATARGKPAAPEAPAAPQNPMKRKVRKSLERLIDLIPD